MSNNEKINNNFFERQQKLKTETSIYMTKDEFMKMMENLRFSHIECASITLISSVIYNTDSDDVEIKKYNITVMKR